MKFTLDNNITAGKATHKEFQSGALFSGASFNGSFAGQYKVSLTVTNKPVDQNTQVDGGEKYPHTQNRCVELVKN